MRLYLDSNVLICLLRSEIDSSFNLRFKDCEQFFSVCSEIGAELVVSDLFLREIKKVMGLEKDAVLGSFDSFGIKVLLFAAAPQKSVYRLAEKTRLHFSDAVHAANALDCGAEAIVSWNKKDFLKAKKFVRCVTPAEFVQGRL